MNKATLKSFATNAHKELIEKVKARAYKLGITEDNIKNTQFESSDAIYINGKQLTATEKRQREKLISRIKEIGYTQVVEEVAYTWFNRFTALRFMEINNYLPTKVRVLSSSNIDSNEPDIIKEALIIELDIDKELVYELKLNNKTEDLFKYLIIKQCNSLNKVLPFMFETIDDYKEILFPEGLLTKDSFLRKMTYTDAISETDWEQVEIIGWLYQFYISDEKDRVFKDKAKFNAEEIPYATQLFTPDWIVRYMVQNSLGRYWIEGHSEHRSLSKTWEFYLQDQNRESEIEEKLAPYVNKELNVESIKCFDPAMGSGHILVYMFEVLYEIYIRCGYMEREIPRLIIENNLFGLDIDDRAYQLACFSVVMKAMEYNKRFFRSIEKDGLTLNLASIQESNSLTNEEVAFIAGVEIGDKYNITKIFIEQFKEAKTLGSLIKVSVYPHEFLEQRLKIIKEQSIDDLFMIEKREKALAILSHLIKQASIMYNFYDVVVTNPPYMGSKNMNAVLSNFLSKHYPDSKADLFAAFMEVDHYLKEYSFYASINQHSWMFLSSFVKLREKVVRNKFIDSMLHLGPRAFEEIGGEVVQSTAFVLRNIAIKNTKGIYLRLVDEKNAKDKRDKALDMIQNSEVSYRFLFNQENFKSIPGSLLAYWVSENITKNFLEPSVGTKMVTREGMATADNDKFLKNWYEVKLTKIVFGCKSNESALEVKGKWFPYNKGGSYRKWYGNNDYIVNWENDGFEIRNNIDVKTGRIRSHNYNGDFGFKKGITWSALSTGSISVRYSDYGFLFDSKGAKGFCDDDSELYYIFGLLNSKIGMAYLEFLSPTMDFKVGDVIQIPLLTSNIKSHIVNKVNENVLISKQDWDSYETSWDFIKHPLIKYPTSSLSSAFESWKESTKNLFNQLKSNEEEINRLFIEMYGMYEELIPDVEDKDITIQKAELEGDIKSFISYAIGCSFGRYSLDEEGLVCAGGVFDPSRYRAFPADKDNIIPVLSEAYFSDDISTQFVKFIAVTFGEEKLYENLDFIADAIGRKNSETSKETINRYLLNDYFKDHVQTYKKKPIYWMFTSGKQRAFNCLIYMHRYDKSTLSRIRTDYLHELQIRMEAEKKTLLDIINGDGTTKEITNAKKVLKSLDLKIEELRVYDEKLHHMADMQIEIDFDEGVALNYAKFEGLLAPIR
ncbi:BREX-1 system adenine-specific DNA-methyltransferase PglX [Paenibacillus glycinis]|uniref:site-specific DNA-methyltransferase (adenine-specific) n=1 Tax=Paenibacillus glycinis TaxID=2697035 RepID=A0ABW9XSI1_9BACL|nr:BREX-1 system adenine-specific DNA-methyltransferase PglX [Paenibacillus glycinis]NBD25622.1 BREX-1 system adenine-specific DNA-methyltransferase PglX [Paenibacillus glycinis]